MKRDFVIGVLGGMGTFATINLFEQYAEVFSAEKEWDRPRIVIDNRCTMPSRVRAFLYNENVDQLVDEMADSMQHLKEAGCNHIILACNTSHLFLPYIYAKVPSLQGSVINIIETCVDRIVEDKKQDIYLLGSEGTIDSGIYQKALEKNNIKCICPQPAEYSMLRYCIEAVKQNQYSDKLKGIFLELINRYDACILGCTELPILYKKYKEDVSCMQIYDPLLISVQKMKEEYDNE